MSPYSFHNYNQDIKTEQKATVFMFWKRVVKAAVQGRGGAIGYGYGYGYEVVFPVYWALNIHFFHFGLS